MKIKDKKILVAMSGGVDSSVTAALLKQQGYDVTGVFMINWPANAEAMADEADTVEPCTWEKDQTDARKVAAKLGIKLFTWNFSKEYKEYVFKYFIEALEQGLTPNPDTICNKYIKFGAFLDRAKQMGFETIATGHYSQIKKSKIKNQKYAYQLLAGRDVTKDQSYFLYELTQAQLKHVIFPLGKLKKKKIREMAKKFDLPVWDKKDSYGICYIGERNMPEFLSQFIKPKPGCIIDQTGKIIGQHQGLYNYTLGQRQGIGVGGVGPFFVVKKDYQNNNLIVTNNSQDENLFTREMLVSNINWIEEQNKKDFNCLVRIRHLKKLEPARLEVLNKNLVKIIFNQPQKAVTPGQVAVFYQVIGLFKRDYEVLGGGIIQSTK
jgi:tRNA-uridine 2-sulfurtransferase